MINRTCEISQQADQDLEDIFDYILSNFGFDQSVSYVSSFDDAFISPEQNSEIGRERNEIRTDLRSLIHQSHVIFYRILEDKIRIVRILHSSRDLLKFL